MDRYNAYGDIRHPGDRGYDSCDTSELWNVYRGRSGQLWFELARDANTITLVPWCAARLDGEVLTWRHFEFCGFQLVGTTRDRGVTVDYL